MSRRLTIEDAHAIAASRGGRCLSPEYVNNRRPLEWECAEGHRWFASFGNVKSRGSWCRACAVQQKCHPLDDVRRAARAHGGRCLSTAYINVLSPLEFECAAGHRWRTSFRAILNGRWCWQCWHERQRDTIDAMRALAASHGGDCLSQSYENQTVPLRWRCANGHEWETTAQNAKQHWCKRCFRERRRLGIGKMHEIAASHGGRCLSEEYISVRHPLQWQCRRGHVWSTQPLGVIRGQWCPLCANLERTKDPIKRMKYDFAG
ncbi:hypothetical protein F4827_005542 [Paraburkholderia bannensis]|uniref:Zinc-ribbon domain-containing protein n=1 Tax=Paraburkholderia bannensis TaxID=765414 RepID=A0A7W9WVU0_9BURK|nr:MULTISPECIES: hypothetical protein [Paraburkholderia]MBB3260767.1 hypothetical protein [Paraburkholderia sp. WP4_3_2]MBB6105672.1 hypothetical protein [Paraburkholderia bannensis]